LILARKRSHLRRVLEKSMELINVTATKTMTAASKAKMITAIS
jgi:hypothetical protein